MNPLSRTSLCLLASLLLLGACGHDAKRDNPFDPELTPSVDVQVALDNSTGTATVTWTEYIGGTPFAEYWVLRKVPGLEAVDTLAVIANVALTSHVDSTLQANTSYSYWVSVVNASGLEVASVEAGEEGYASAPVSLFDLEVDPQKGSVLLRWNRYSGGRFEAYRVERFRLDLLDFERIARISNISDTLFTDHDPVLEVSRYRVVVEAAGETWMSNNSDRVRLTSPAVSLLGVEGNEEGVALVWSQYSGEDPFLSYEIRRRLAGESMPETLVTITDVATTSFVDTDVEIGVHVYSVVVSISTSGVELPGDAMEIFFSVLNPQDSISEAMAIARHGDTILLSPGTYTEMVELKSGVTLRGMSREDVVLAPLGGPALVAKDITGSAVENLSVVGSGGDDEPAVLILNAGITLRNFDIRDSETTWAIVVSGASNDVTIQGCLVTQIELP